MAGQSEVQTREVGFYQGVVVEVKPGKNEVELS